MNLRPLAFITIASAALTLVHAADLHDLVAKKIDAEYPSLEAIYKDVHAHPELSFMEVRTAALVASEMRALGFTVTEGVGGRGVVAVLKNGEGPTVMVRADMDALPVKELTGLPYASKVVMNDFTGKEQPAMHACAHDSHVTDLIGTARVLTSLKDHWAGTLIMIGQPAEEAIGGARAMLTDGLFTRFPTPNFVVALHTVSDLPMGYIGYVVGPSYANVDSVDILVRGVGGHGAAPQTTRDPIVVAAEIIGALQTIVSRELRPGTPAVVTVGTIHGGTRRNIIPSEVKLELTIRCYSEETADQMIAAIKRISTGIAQAAGVPADLMPVVTVAETRNPVTYNDPTLTQRLGGVFRAWFPADQVSAQEPFTYGEDFAEYGRTTHHVPICIFSVGGTDPAVIADAHKRGVPVPSNHSAYFAPVPEPTIKAGVTAMSAAVLDLLAKK